MIAKFLEWLCSYESESHRRFAERFLIGSNYKYKKLSK